MQPAHVLIVANRTAESPALLEFVRDRASHAPARFHLVVPASPPGLHKLVDPEDHGREEAMTNLRTALPALSVAARSEVNGHVGDPNPVAALEDAVHEGTYDEIIVSTLHSRVSRWMRMDLPSKASHLGLPVTHVSPDAVEACRIEAVAA
jgi:hypothetical protein